MMRTPIHLLAIAGLGLVLGTGHALIRTLVLDEPAVRLTRVVKADIPASPADPEDLPSDGTDSTPEPGTFDVPTNSGSDITISDPIEPVSKLDALLDAPVKPGSINLREAHELFLAGAFFLDARNADDFAAGRIEGAIWMPAFHANTSEGQADLDFIPPGDTVVIYCTGGDCDASENTANRLELLQYEFDIKIMGKGYVDWIEAELPIEAGEASP